MKRILITLAISLIAIVVFESCAGSTGEADGKVEEDVLFLINEDGKFGYVNREGKIVIAPQFIDAQVFSEGLACVWVGNLEDGKYGYIDKSGKIVINPQFAEANEFSEGMALVRMVGRSLLVPSKEGDCENNWRWRFIDKTGEFVGDMQFEYAHNFSEGLALVNIGNRYGYIDKNGKIAINPQFSHAEDFSEGLALVYAEDPQCDKYDYLKWMEENAPSGYMEYIHGEVTGFSKVGYIDKEGALVIKPQFFMARAFSDGMAAVNVRDKWGFIDKNGEMVIKPQFDAVGAFSEGLACVEIGGKWGYINKTGIFVINPKYDDAEDFSEGMASVEVNGLECFIDKKGNNIIEPQFGWLSPFKNGLAYAAGGKAGNISGLIDKTGKYIWCSSSSAGPYRYARTACEGLR